VDIRIIVATNRDLAAMVQHGTFREDLYFRLSMFQIALPPLRERKDDIQPFIRFLLNHGRDSGHAEQFDIEPEAEALLLAYSWPGNIRELDNVINRARILAEGNRITVADLPSALVAAASPALPSTEATSAEGSLRQQLHRLEIRLIQEAVALAEGDRRVAAQRLGISLSGLYRKLGEA
jgi:two-component system response regulator AtoC